MLVPLKKLYFCTSGQEKLGPDRKKLGPDTVLSDQEELIVLQLFLDKPGIYLREVQQELYDATGTWGRLLYLV